MLIEEIGTGRTVEAAIANGAEKLGVEVSGLQYDVLEAPKKGFLGFGEAPAKVRVYYEVGPEHVALEYVNKVIDFVGADNAKAYIARELNSEGGKVIKVDGDESGMLIGRHGETLDAIQYLSNLSINAYLDKNGGECPKITVDVGGYRARREETLRNLAKRTADKVKKYKRNIALDPMSPYERRIIHAALQNDPLVYTASVGSDENRKVVVHYAPKSEKRAAEQNAE